MTDKPEKERLKLTSRKYATNEQIIEALELTRGNIARAARALGYKPATLRNILCKDPDLRAAKEEIREASLDLAEDKLTEHIYEKNSLPALMEYLKAAGRKRGYGSQSIDMQIEGKIEHSVDDALLEGLIKKFEEKLEDDK